MVPARKTHHDIGLDNPTIGASDKAVIQTTPEGDLTDNADTARQEYAKDADINYMLHKFGITPERGAPTFGEWDDTIDLQTALASVHEARNAYAKLPHALTSKFRSMEEILEAYNNGSLVITDGEVPVPPKSETELLQERIAELEKRLPNT